MRAKVQKPSKETRHLQFLFQINADKIKTSSGLSSAAKIILQSLHPSNPWRKLANSELIEKFEHHAETLLSDFAFVESFKDWSGFEEIKSFCTDKKWWKRRRKTQNRAGPGRRRIRISQEDSFESSEPTRSGSLESASVDDDLTIETPAQGYRKTAKKGTSILRPRLSMSHTPGTPTRQLEKQLSMSPDGLVGSEMDLSDGELELVQLPADVSQRIKNDKLPTRKRKSEEIIENDSKRSRSYRKEVSINPRSFQFGRGRPPLTTVPVFFHESNLMIDPDVLQCIQ